MTWGFWTQWNKNGSFDKVFSKRGACLFLKILILGWFQDADIEDSCNRIDKKKKQTNKTATRIEEMIQK